MPQFIRPSPVGRSRPSVEDGGRRHSPRPRPDTRRYAGWWDRPSTPRLPQLASDGDPGEGYDPTSGSQNLPRTDDADDGVADRAADGIEGLGGIDGIDGIDGMDGAVASLVAGVDAIAGLDLDAGGPSELKALLRSVQQQIDRLAAQRAVVTGELGRRARAAAGPGREGTVDRELQQTLRDELRLAPTDAKQTARTARRLAEAKGALTPNPTAERFTRGELSQAHVAIIDDALLQVPREDREAFEADLVEAAARLDPIALGRYVRRRVLEIDPGRGRAAEERRRRSRRFTMATTADGGVAVSGWLSGLQAEKALTAFHAFREADAPDGESRSPEQRGADAFEALCDAALQAGTAKARHGVRPHVQVQIPWSVLEEGAGGVELGLTGPVSFEEIRPLLSDASVARLVLDPDGVPIEVSEQVRTVPAGLWRALVARDGHCTWSGCDAPPAWCQVAHGNVPFRFEGRLRLDNAALLCTRHHRRFDGGGWTMRIDGRQVTYHRTSADGPPGQVGADPPDGGSGGAGSGGTGSGGPGNGSADDGGAAS